MKYKSISYYSKERKPISLRLLNYNDDCALTDVFLVVAEANDSQELLSHLQNIFSNEILLINEGQRYITYLIDNTNYLKVKFCKN